MPCQNHYLKTTDYNVLSCLLTQNQVLEGAPAYF